MPTYEYECETCKRTIEVEQRISDPPLTNCRQLVHEFKVRYCDGPLHRLIAGQTGFVLKGSGWAKDGY